MKMTKQAPIKITIPEDDALRAFLKTPPPRKKKAKKKSVSKKG
jgi:hypothetical protein